MIETALPSHVAHKSMILLLQDERKIRDVAKICLELEDYTVLDTGSPYEALDLWNQWSERIELFIADSGIPEMPGTHLADLFIEQQPDLKVLFATGGPSARMFDLQRANQNVRLIEKPYLMQRLVEMVNTFIGFQKKHWHS